MQQVTNSRAGDFDAWRKTGNLSKVRTFIFGLSTFTINTLNQVSLIFIQAFVDIQNKQTVK